MESSHVQSPYDGGEESGAVVFMRTGETDSDSLNDIWDDTALIKAYDKAMKQAQQTNEKLKPVKSKKKKSKKKHHPNKQPSSYKWVVGDNCQARYSEDNQIYAAIITDILDDEQCIVRYIDYGNEEEQLLKDLKPTDTETHTKSHVKSRSRSSSVSMSCSECSQQNLHMQNPGRHFLQGFHNAPLSGSGHGPMGMPSFIPPPPPSLPEMSPCDTNEAFHSMLISWYMSGYHTGYYQGLKDANRIREHS